MDRKKLLGQLIRFGMATAVSASVSFVLPLALHALAGVPERSSVGIAFCLAYLLNFAMLRRVVFRADRPIAGQFAVYAITNAAFRAGEFAAFDLARAWVPGFGYALTLLGVLALSTLVKFFAYRRVFRQPG